LEVAEVVHTRNLTTPAAAEALVAVEPITAYEPADPLPRAKALTVAVVAPKPTPTVVPVVVVVPARLVAQV
jgi:hypothetical protein